MSQPDLTPNNKIIRVTAILTLNKALLGKVFPIVRAARIDWNDDKIILYFYYDGEISEEDHESLESVAKEVISDFSEYNLDLNIKRGDYPEQLLQKEELVYRRKEVTPEIYEISHYFNKNN